MTTETLSEMRGMSVIALEEAANLGKVDQLLVDPESKKLAAVAFKNRQSGAQMYVESGDITKMGAELALIASEKAAKPFIDGERPGRRLTKLRGMRVTTNGGELLGKLDDFDLDTGTWALSELHFEGNRSLPIDPADVVIGRDQIVVPQSYAERMVEAPNGGNRGFFKRVRDWTRSQPSRQ